MGRFFAEKLLPFLIAPIYWLLSRTWRIEEIGLPSVLTLYVQSPTPRPCLYAHWHGDELVLVGYYAYRRLGVLASLSKDGSIMARTLELLGYQVFRGSSSRGGARGLIGLIKCVKDGSQGSLAVDGPKGPIYEVKPGIIELARKTGQPIVPVRTHADRVWWIPRAWNHSYFPKPFARVKVQYGPEILVGPSDSADTLAAAVKAALDRLPAQGLRPQK